MATLLCVNTAAEASERWASVGLWQEVEDRAAGESAAPWQLMPGPYGLGLLSV